MTNPPENVTKEIPNSDRGFKTQWWGKKWGCTRTTKELTGHIGNSVEGDMGDRERPLIS